MAKIKLQGHASGTGILTVTAPNTSTDRTITLPDATATLMTNAGGTFTGDLAIGSYTANSNADNLVIQEANDFTGITLAADNDQGSNIYFADPEDNNVGGITYNHSSNYMNFRVNGAERLRVLSSGGLTFNGDTAAANALSDYEEGTFTPLLKFSGATTGIVQNSSYTTGWYTKVGNLVNFGFILILSSKGSASGSAQITGLPFALNDSTYQQTTLSLSMENVSFADQNWAYMPRNNTVITLRESTNAGSGSNIADTNVANNSQFMCQGTYISG